MMKLTLSLYKRFVSFTLDNVYLQQMPRFPFFSYSYTQSRTLPTVPTNPRFLQAYTTYANVRSFRNTGTGQEENTGSRLPSYVGLLSAGVLGLSDQRQSWTELSDDDLYRAWHITEYKHGKHYQETSFDPRFTVNGDRAREISQATGTDVKEIIIYEPKRLALHELLIHLTLRFKFSEDTQLREVADDFYEDHIVPLINQHQGKFEDKRKEIEEKVHQFLEKPHYPSDPTLAQEINSLHQRMLKNTEYQVVSMSTLMPNQKLHPHTLYVERAKTGNLHYKVLGRDGSVLADRIAANDKDFKECSDP